MVTEITVESRTSTTIYIQCGWGLHIYILSSRSLLTVVQCLKYDMKCTGLVTKKTAHCVRLLELLEQACLSKNRKSRIFFFLKKVICPEKLCIILQSTSSIAV